MKTIKCFRFVTKDMKSEKGNTSWKIGKWNKHEGDIELCSKGFHASISPLDNLEYINGDRWFIAEARDKIIKGNHKIVASELRLVKEIPEIVLKRFALFCAKDCLKNWTDEYPDDNRVSECIRITELYLDGKASLDELIKAEKETERASARASTGAWARARASASAKASASASARASTGAWASASASARARACAWASVSAKASARASASASARARASASAKASARACAWASVSASASARASTWASVGAGAGARASARASADASADASAKQLKELNRLIKEYTK